MEGLDDLLVVIGGDDATNERVKRAIFERMAQTYKCLHCWKVEDNSKGVALDDGRMACRRCAKELAR